MTIRIAISHHGELVSETMYADADNVEALAFAECSVFGMSGEVVEFWFNRRVLIRWIEGVEYHGQWWIGSDQNS